MKLMRIDLNRMSIGDRLRERRSSASSSSARFLTTSNVQAGVLLPVEVSMRSVRKSEEGKPRLRFVGSGKDVDDVLKADYSRPTYILPSQHFDPHPNFPYQHTPASWAGVIFLKSILTAALLFQRMRIAVLRLAFSRTRIKEVVFCVLHSESD